VTGSALEAARRLLESCRTATIATATAQGPWAAAVFFASDPDLRLYFVSDRNTRHGRDLAVNPAVAATVHGDCAAWSEIRGLQMSGRVEILDGDARAPGLEMYLAKFPEVAALVRQPASADESRIASRLEAASLYRLTPGWVRVIDNTRGFGFRQELDL
jgi:uncharacterized protein YhbP (UPF0306 family)